MLKKICFFVLCSFIALALKAQSAEAEILKRTEVLINAGQYLTAYKMLYNADSLDLNTTYLLEKERIALGFHYKTQGHHSFTFRNFSVGETAENVIGHEGKMETFKIQFDEKIDRFLRLYPDNYYLLRGIGDFYQAIADTYGDKGEYNLQDIFLRINQYYGLANDTKGTFESLFGEGHAKTFLGQFKAAKEPLKKALELNSTDATTNYDLAYCYWATGVRDSALTNAFIALDSFKLADRKADALFIIGSVYGEQGLNKMAIKYFEMANTYYLKDQRILNELMLNYLFIQNYSQAAEYANILFELDPTKAETYNDLQAVYTEASHLDQLIIFFESKIPVYSKNLSALGALHFYMAGALLNEGKNELARLHFIAAKNTFLKFVAKDHAVITKINEALLLCDSVGK